MNGSKGLAAQVVDAASKAISGMPEAPEVVLCPPFTLLNSLKDIINSLPIKLGGQDCHGERHGAFTGEISAELLKEAGCTHVILGHSERRQFHAETDEVVEKKCQTALKMGLTPIICVGETLFEREKRLAVSVVKSQLEASIPLGTDPSKALIAYEPVWAIGTGKVPSDDDIEEMHALIKEKMPGFAVLYGGSVKASNANAILRLIGVDGVLVGGASIEPDSFASIVRAGS